MSGNNNITKRLRRRVILLLPDTLLLLLLLSSLLACGGAPPAPEPPAPPAAPAEAPPLSRVVIQDFANGMKNNLGGGGGTWNAEESDTLSTVAFEFLQANPADTTDYCLKLAYSLNPARSSQNGLWMRLNGLDGSNYDHLEFRVKGDAAAGFDPRFKVEFKKPKPGSELEQDKGSFVVEGVTAEWQRVRIPLNMMNGITDWKNLGELVLSFHSRRARVHKGAYFLDDFALVKTGEPGLSIYDRVAVPRKRAWEAEHGGETAAVAAIHACLNGWPTMALADRRSFPRDDREFLLRIARDTWKGIDALCDRERGLPLDTVRFTKGSVLLKDSRIGDYTNVTNIGVYFLCVVGAQELGLITRDEALEKLKKTLASVEGMESHEGFLFNYYDTTSGERTSNFISFVDSAWLTSGLMAVRQAFPELAARCSQLIDRGDYGFFYDDVEQHMNHGFYVHMGVRAEYNYGAFYTEPRAGSFIAIGKGDVPEEHWYRMLRTFPVDAKWQSETPVARVERTTRGVTYPGGHYEWKGLAYVPSWGGSLFEALMPTMVIDEKQFAPLSLGRNDEVHSIIHRRYALEVMKYPVWGMSPSSVPTEDNYSEYGVRPLGAHGYKPGAVTPHVVALAVNFTPKEAIANLRKLIELYDIYGEYGFYDAVDPVSGSVAYKYLALDQGMLFVALANYLGDGCVQKRFMADPIAQRALPMLAEERFF